MESSLFALTVRVLAVLIILVYLLPLQVKELDRPRDGLFWLRIIILSFLALFVTLSIPSIVHHFYMVNGTEIESLRKLATVCTNLSILLVPLWLISVYSYREKK